MLQATLAEGRGGKKCRVTPAAVSHHEGPAGLFLEGHCRATTDEAGRRTPVFLPSPRRAMDRGPFPPLTSAEGQGHVGRCEPQNRSGVRRHEAIRRSIPPYPRSPAGGGVNGGRDSDHLVVVRTQNARVFDLGLPGQANSRQAGRQAGRHTLHCTGRSRCGHDGGSEHLQPHRQLWGVSVARQGSSAS